MERWQGRVALVTGASSGIGAAICESLVRSGMKVVGAARRVDRIQTLANNMKGLKGSLMAVRCDLNEDEDVYALFDTIKKTYGGVDICINNAATAYQTSLLDGTPDEWRHVSNVNVIALCLCTKLAVASMKERNVDDGHIINISSIAGHQVIPLPSVHFYTGTKFAVQALSEGVRQELRQANSRIRVTVVGPGLVRTEMIEKLIPEDGDLEKFFEAMAHLRVGDVADTILHIIKAPAHVEINDVIITPTGEDTLKIASLLN